MRNLPWGWCRPRCLGKRRQDLSTRGAKRISASPPDDDARLVARSQNRQPRKTRCETCGRWRRSIRDLPCAGAASSPKAGGRASPSQIYYRPSFLTTSSRTTARCATRCWTNWSSERYARKWGRCSDCHDSSSKRRAARSARSVSQPQVFAPASRTGHPAGPGQPDCIGCHMPSTYMVVDARHDHSFQSRGPTFPCRSAHRTPATIAIETSRPPGPPRSRWNDSRSQPQGIQTYAAGVSARRASASRRPPTSC